MKNDQEPPSELDNEDLSTPVALEDKYALTNISSQKVLVLKFRPERFLAKALYQVNVLMRTHLIS